MTDADLPWRGWANAEIYAEFARRPGGIYERLNRSLVELAELPSARRVLDVGCGTGATARACLARLPADATYTGVDASPEMLAVARANLDDPRASFHLASAGNLGDAIDGEFDRALSNAAFWQFPAPAKVIASLAEHLAPGSLWVFNVPEERVVGGKASVHPFQAALARALEEAAGETLTGGVIRLDPDDLEASLERAGLPLIRRERRVYSLRQGDLADLMEIPAMAAPLAPDLSEPERLEALGAARRQVEAEQLVEVAWRFFVCRRVARVADDTVSG